MNNPIIVALDVANAGEARGIVRALAGTVDYFKVGLELYSGAGMDYVKELLSEGKQVFLDLKFYDIPETVKRATARVVESGVQMLTVHGSQAILEAAAEGRGNAPLKLLGVSVLTSFDQKDLEDLGFPTPVEDLVRLRVKNAMAHGIDGIVCSPREAGMVRGLTGPGAILVTPGVRSAGKDTGDQKRTATPAAALAAGATYLVIGREITRAVDPQKEAERILEEVAAAQPA